MKKNVYNMFGRSENMKTVTCKQMGGPCDTKIQGNTPDEIMHKGDDHVNEMAAKG